MSLLKIELPLSEPEFQDAKVENGSYAMVLYERSRSFLNAVNLLFLVAIAILIFDGFIFLTILLFNAVEESYPSLFFIALGQPVVAVLVLLYAAIDVFFDNDLTTTNTWVIGALTLIAALEMFAEVVNLALRINAAGNVWSDIFDGQQIDGPTAFTEILYVVFAVALTIMSVIQVTRSAVVLALTARYVEQQNKFRKEIREKASPLPPATTGQSQLSSSTVSRVFGGGQQTMKKRK